MISDNDFLTVLFPIGIVVLVLIVILIIRKDKD